MTFRPDPKPAAINKKSKGIDMTSKKKYKCGYCGDDYYMVKANYSKVERVGNKKPCHRVECKSSHAMKHLEKLKAKQKEKIKKDWNDRKKGLKEELGVKKKQSQQPLQKSINKIVRLLDKEEPCLARPTENHVAFDAGHIFSVGSHPSLRYNVWNIFKQSVKSNRDLAGEQLMMMEGVEIRYGKDKREYIETLPSLYPILKLTADEKRVALKIANRLIREIEKGADFTRDQINEYLGIYK